LRASSRFGEAPADKIALIDRFEPGRRNHALTAGDRQPLVRSCWSSAGVLHKRTAIQAQSAAMFARHHDWITC
jgi:hypothetical protein